MLQPPVVRFWELEGNQVRGEERLYASSWVCGGGGYALKTLKILKPLKSRGLSPGAGPWALGVWRSPKH